MYALSVHFCHGIRHLAWDLGKGFDKRRQTFLNALEILGSIVMTLLTYGGASFLQSGIAP